VSPCCTRDRRRDHLQQNRGAHLERVAGYSNDALLLRLPVRRGDAPLAISVGTQHTASTERRHRGPSGFLGSWAPDTVADLPTLAYWRYRPSR
jgi:hypothetical protein